MQIALINPPQAHFTQPLLAIPSLAAYLRLNGYRNVHCFDAGIESYDYFLTPQRLTRAAARIAAEKAILKLDDKPNLHFSEMEDYQQYSEIAVSSGQVIAGIEEAKATLRTPRDFYQYEKYLWAGRTVEQALRMISAEFSPTRLTPHGFVMKQNIERSGDILDAIGDDKHNPYIEYFREEFMPRLKAANPDVVGISVTFGSQAIPAFTLARMIREWKPECYITLGGGLLAYVAHKLAKRPEVWGVIDSFVMLEGERPLLEICRAVEASLKTGMPPDVSRIPNLIYFDRARVQVSRNPEVEPLDIKTLPTPDFDGLPLHLYLSPELVLPLAITRGCYWGKCVFCTLYTVIGPGYRGRTIEQTVDDIRTLKEKYKTRHFYMVIEDLPPNMAKRLPAEILAANLDIDWWCDARLEHDVFDEATCRDLARSGCKRIAFGYESASQRVLDRMCKGIDPVKSMQLIHRCHDAGISVTLYVMIGFPTETREEAAHTLRTILANREKIQEVSVRVFYLDEQSEIYKRSKEFDIQEIHPDPGADLQVYYDFTPGSGMTRREARGMYLEFTRALRSYFPVFQNTNMLYHELKSHYFLYLTKFGSFENLRRLVLEPSVTTITGFSGDAIPVRRAGLSGRALRFDRGEIDTQVSALDSATVRPRYQADLLEEEDRARFDREVPPIAPSASFLVRVPTTGEIHCLSRDAADLLFACDGRQTTTEILQNLPRDARDPGRDAIETLISLGLLTIQSSTSHSTVHP